MISNIISVSDVDFYSSQDSDDEHFMDVEEEEEGEKVSPKEPSKTKTKTETKPTEDHSSWVHRQQKQGDSKGTDGVMCNVYYILSLMPGIS